MKNLNWRRILTIHMISEQELERMSTEQADKVLQDFVRMVETLPTDEEIKECITEVESIRPVLH